MSQLDVVNVMRDLLECARAEVQRQDNTWDGRLCMNPYSVPTRDDCCGGQIQGTIVRYFSFDTFPLDQITSTPCNAFGMAADVVISIYDCFTGMGQHGQPRDCVSLDNATDLVTVQAAAVWNGVLCCLNEMDIDWLFRSQLILDNEQGGCIGSDLSLTLGVGFGCPCG